MLFLIFWMSKFVFIHYLPNLVIQGGPKRMQRLCSVISTTFLIECHWFFTVHVFWKWHCLRKIALYRIKTPYPYLMNLVSNYLEKNILSNTAKIQQCYSIKNVVEITDQNRCILSGPPCIVSIYSSVLNTLFMFQSITVLSFSSETGFPYNTKLVHILVKPVRTYNIYHPVSKPRSKSLNAFM